MATEATASRGFLSLRNLIMEPAASLISVTSEAPLYPGTNLLNPLRSKRWRSTTVGSTQYLAFDLGTPVKLTLIGLIDVNLADVTALQFQSSSASDFSANLKTYTYFTYAQNWDGNRIVRFLIGEPDSGASAAHQYWRVVFPANTQKSGYSYFELGTVWMGTYTEVDIDVGVGISIDDDSDIEVAYNGAKYPDIIRSMRTIDLTLPLLDTTTLFGLKGEFDRAGAVKYIFADIFANTGNATQKPHSSYYGTVSSGAAISQETPTYGNLEFSLEEAVG